MSEFRMPSLGADMTEGTLLRWYAHPGDPVHKGDLVAEVDTAKAAIEIECFDDGVLGELLVPEGATVPVGTVLATIEPAAVATAPHTERSQVERAQVDRAQVEAAQLEPAQVEPVHVEPAQVEAAHAERAQAERRRAERAHAEPVASGEHGAGVSATATGPAGRRRKAVRKRTPVPPESPPAERAAVPAAIGPRVTPLIRKLATAAGVDLAALHGSGPDGRIVRADVERAAAAAGPPQPPHGPAAGPPRAKRHVRATGYARRLARELGIDPTSVRGTGPDGALRAADIRAAATVAAVPPEHESGTVTPEPASRATAAEPPTTGHDAASMRDLITAAMTRSKQTVPHYYLSATVDVGAATEHLRERNLRLPVAERILLAALLFCAIARAARAVPELNAHWVDGGFRPAERVHLGVVVSLRGGGIILPTIPDADTLDPPAMMAAIRGVVARARAGKLRSSDATPATLSVTNLGDLGVDSIFGVIAVPQVAIVGLGAVSDRPCAVGGLLGVRPQLTATLSADHRASDGMVGARFLDTVSGLLQRPQEL